MGKTRWLVYLIIAGVVAGTMAFPIASLSVSTQNRKDRTADGPVSLLYASQVYGQVRSCNCTKFRYGGYGRQATLMKQLSDQSANVVLVDCGDALSGDTSTQGQFKRDLTARIMSKIGYNAWVAGATEIAADLHAVNEKCAELGVPVTCANVFDSSTGKRVCPSHISYKTPGGVRVAIIGLFSKNLVSNDVLRKTGVKVGDPADLLRKMAPGIKKSADLIVVAAHMPLAEATAIAELGIGDVVICSHIERELHMPDKDENVVEVPYTTIGNVIFLRSLTRSNWSVGKLEIKRAKANKWQASSNSLLYMDRDYDEHPEIVKLFDEHNESLRDHYIKQRDKMRAELDAKVRASGLDPDEIRERNKRFAGHGACRECHSKAYEVWASSRHSRAIDTLKKTKQEYDTECIDCHTTGRHQMTGFVNMKETPELANVQCEACHGPGKEHIAKPAKGFGATGEANCRGCHTDELDPEFDYELRWKKIAH